MKTRIAITGIGLGMGLCGLGPSAAAPMPAAPLAPAAALVAATPHSLTVMVEGMRSTRGMVQVCLTSRPSNFPDCREDPEGRRMSVPAATAAQGFSVDHLPRGEYALAIIHDENGNRKLDTFAGIPKEGVGFSRNPAIRFGAPSFSSAQFAVGASPVRQDVRVKYFL